MAETVKQHYITIQEFMVKDLELKGNELIAYALIYGFSQDEESYFKGSLSYVANWLNCSKTTAHSILNKLADDGFLEKKEKNINGVKLCDYMAVVPNKIELKEAKERKESRKEKEKSERRSKKLNTPSKNNNGRSKNCNGYSKNLNEGVQESVTHNNTDILNDIKDDNTDENIDNSFSEEKDPSNSPEGQCNSFSGEKKGTHSPKQNKPLSEKELEQANYKMPHRACKIAYSLTNNKDLANNVMDFFQYFLDERKKHTGTWHIPLSDTTLAKVVATLIEDIKVDRGDYEDTYFSLVIDTPGNNDYEEVVDKYFETKFKSKVDYSIVHFTQENVLINIMNHCGKENWCTSGI